MITERKTVDRDYLVNTFPLSSYIKTKGNNGKEVFSDERIKD